MRNVIRRAGSGVLAATMAIGLVGCGDDTVEPSETGDAPEEETTTSSAPAEE